MCIEVVVWNSLHLGESWRRRKGLERPRKASERWQVWVATEVFSVATKLSSFVLRQDLVLEECSWAAAMVALCHDNVTTDVPLSRLRRS